MLATINRLIALANNPLKKLEYIKLLKEAALCEKNIDGTRYVTSTEIDIPKEAQIFGFNQERIFIYALTSEPSNPPIWCYSQKSLQYLSYFLIHELLKLNPDEDIIRELLVLTATLPNPAEFELKPEMCLFEFIYRHHSNFRNFCLTIPIRGFSFAEDRLEVCLKLAEENKEEYDEVKLNEHLKNADLAFNYLMQLKKTQDAAIRLPLQKYFNFFKTKLQFAIDQVNDTSPTTQEHDAAITEVKDILLYLQWNTIFKDITLIAFSQITLSTNMATIWCLYLERKEDDEWKKILKLLISLNYHHAIANLLNKFPLGDFKNQVLFYSVQCGQLNIAKLALGKGANINFEINGKTVLEEALELDDLAKVKVAGYLLENGAFGYVDSLDANRILTKILCHPHWIELATFLLKSIPTQHDRFFILNAIQLRSVQSLIQLKVAAKPPRYDDSVFNQRDLEILLNDTWKKQEHGHSPTFYIFNAINRLIILNQQGATTLKKFQVSVALQIFCSNPIFCQEFLGKNGEGMDFDVRECFNLLKKAQENLQNYAAELDEVYFSLFLQMAPDQRPQLLSEIGEAGLFRLFFYAINRAQSAVQKWERGEGHPYWHVVIFLYSALPKNFRYHIRYPLPFMGVDNPTPWQVALLSNLPQQMLIDFGKQQDEPDSITLKLICTLKNSKNILPHFVIPQPFVFLMGAVKYLELETLRQSDFFDKLFGITMKASECQDPIHKQYLLKSEEIRNKVWNATHLIEGRLHTLLTALVGDGFERVKVLMEFFNFCKKDFEEFKKVINWSHSKTPSALRTVIQLYKESKEDDKTKILSTIQLLLNVGAEFEWEWIRGANLEATFFPHAKQVKPQSLSNYLWEGTAPGPMDIAIAVEDTPLELNDFLRPISF